MESNFQITRPKSYRHTYVDKTNEVGDFETSHDLGQGFTDMRRELQKAPSLAHQYA